MQFASWVRVLVSCADGHTIELSQNEDSLLFGTVGYRLLLSLVLLFVIIIIIDIFIIHLVTLSLIIF
jgi:hypothetical protein